VKASAESVSAVVGSVSAFNADLFLKLVQEKPGSNVFFSPFSLSSALFMTVSPFFPLSLGPFLACLLANQKAKKRRYCFTKVFIDSQKSLR